jgi:hypothetical protein
MKSLYVASVATAIALLLGVASLGAAQPGHAAQIFPAQSHAGAHSHGTNGMRLGRGSRAFVPSPEFPDLQNRIPAPLPAPPQAPVINGPLNPHGM